jgi:hypothetical protein
MGDESEGDGEPLFTTKRQRDPQSKSPFAENQQQEGNDNVAKDATGAETESSVSSDDEETDVDTKKKARVALYWSNKHEKEAAADAVWASTVFDIVVVRELAHTHDKTITYSGNPDSVVDLYPYQRAVAGSKLLLYGPHCGSSQIPEEGCKGSSHSGSNLQAVWQRGTAFLH